MPTSPSWREHGPLKPITIPTKKKKKPIKIISKIFYIRFLDVNYLNIFNKSIFDMLKKFQYLLIYYWLELQLNYARANLYMPN